MSQINYLKHNIFNSSNEFKTFNLKRIAEELFECVYSFCGVGGKGVQQ